MSTNYYINDLMGQTMHIGKSSVGWQFLFNVGNHDAVDPLDSYDNWMNYLVIATGWKGHQIEDEYGRPVTLAELQERIISTQKTGVNGWTAPDDIVGPFAARRRKDNNDVMENYCRKGFRFSTSRDFS